MKVGKIASFSLTPVVTCPNHKWCKDKCYALKAYRMYPNTKTAYDRNTELAKNNLPELKSQLIKFLKDYKKEYFRIHVAGDFFSQDYLDMWFEVVKIFKNMKFLAFTKAYSLKYDSKPDNLEILLSTFDTMPKDTDEKLEKKYGFKVALAGSKAPKNYHDCPGNCETCKTCWHATEQNTNIFFHYH